MVFAVVSALCVSGPAWYWRLKKTMASEDKISSSCAPCTCDCPPPLSLLKIAPGIFLFFPLSLTSLLLGLI